jgi:hypothetical protein
MINEKSLGFKSFFSLELVFKRIKRIINFGITIKVKNLIRKITDLEK